MSYDSTPWYDETHPHGKPGPTQGQRTVQQILAQPPALVAALAITNTAGQILVGFNVKRQVWDIPQGVVEPTDSGPWQAAVRELREETGLCVEESDLELVAEFRHVTPQFCGSFKNHIFVPRFGFSEEMLSAVHNAEPEKCGRLCWFAPCQLPSPRGLSLRTYLAIAGLTC